MQTDQTILNEVIQLQALHEDGLKRATTLRELLERGASSSPKTLRRKEIVAAAVNHRNIHITKKSKSAGIKS